MTLEDMKAELNSLQETVKRNFLPLSEKSLNYKSDATSWNVLECLEHLNLYSAYYNQELEKAIKKAAGSLPLKENKLSWLGRKSVEGVSLQNQKKQKTFKHMNPANSHLSAKDTLERFLAYQAELIAIIDRCKNIGLHKKGVRVEFFKLLRLSIFDTLVFMLEHEKRHIAQAVRAADSGRQQYQQHESNTSTIKHKS